MYVRFHFEETTDPFAEVQPYQGYYTDRIDLSRMLHAYRYNGDPEAEEFLLRFDTKYCLQNHIGYSPDDADTAILYDNIGELPLAPRHRSALYRAGVTAIGELVSRTEKEVLLLHNIGRTTLSFVQEALMKCGLSFRESSVLPTFGHLWRRVGEDSLIPASEHYDTYADGDGAWAKNRSEILERLTCLTWRVALHETTADKKQQFACDRQAIAVELQHIVDDLMKRISD